MAVETTELTVQGQSLQSLFTQYSQGTFLVNRRYQRKLVWEVEEKERLIDSIANKLPIPLVLLAESSFDDASRFEIIDGLQRLNAIFSFFENEFTYGGKYFDLDTLADTKYLRDQGQLVQKTPVLDRAVCLAVVNYQLPVSIYRSATEESVDEVFRRINSSGRKLSLQEIRQAGVSTDFANLVRRISASVRGDASLSDIVPLKEMPKISITNRELPYGILSEDIFWVKNGILDKDSVRESRDEELVLDILLDLILDPIAVSGSEYRNAAYNRDSNPSTSADTVAARLNVLGADVVQERFTYTLDLIKRLIDAAGVQWSRWVITQQNPRGIPRYFHAIFVAMYELLFIEKLEVDNFSGLNAELKNIWDRNLAIPGGGGSWGVNRKRPLFDSVKAHLRPHFKDRNDPLSLRIRDTETQLEIELQMALTEKSLFELKQGFTRLEPHAVFDDNSFGKVLRTASAMANRGPNSKGRIFFGVADVEADAERVRSLHNIAYMKVGSFYVTGTMHELKALGRSVDEQLRWLIDKIKSSKLEQDFATRLAASLVPLEYKGFLIWSLEVEAGLQPTSWDGVFYDRQGNSTVEVSGPATVDLMRRFLG
ncbi:DUF262 domain-containing protein [Nocardia farcinica]|uniref:DUF262 domain-containing protein n=1 Tax=Nocardia farcinica TaxID=37329 RepID=UPI002457224C|nr:DUF262 domain-containing protein [Nocardia farcinica]